MAETQVWAAWRHSQRQKLIARRQSLSEVERISAQQQIQDHLLTLLAPVKPGTIGFYMPIRGEMNCQPLIEQLLAYGWLAASPKIVAKDAALQFRQWTPDCDMAPEIWQIPVPQNTRELTPDVLLIPLVGFDKQLHRLGNGGGFYDRSLAAIKPKPLAIGIGLETLKLVDIQPQPHDIAMDIVVTEQAVYSLRPHPA